MDPRALRARLLSSGSLSENGPEAEQERRPPAAVLTLGACGDDDTPEAAADPGAETTVADTTVADTSGDDGGAAETVTVQIPEFAFDPTPIEVGVGGSVVWENAHTQPHTSSGNGDQDWDTGPIQPGDTSDAVTFDEAGTFTSSS